MSEPGPALDHLLDDAAALGREAVALAELPAGSRRTVADCAAAASTAPHADWAVYYAITAARTLSGAAGHMDVPLTPELAARLDRTLAEAWALAPDVAGRSTPDLDRVLQRRRDRLGLPADPAPDGRAPLAAPPAGTRSGVSDDPTEGDHA